MDMKAVLRSMSWPVNKSSISVTVVESRRHFRVTGRGVEGGHDHACNSSLLLRKVECT